MQLDRRRWLLGGAAVALAATAGLAWLAGALDELFGAADLLRAGPLGDQAIGAADAPVTVIEYASMTCPHCARFSVETFPALKQRYIDTGKVRFIFREYPLDGLAAGAAMLPRCAGGDKFFPAVELLFRTQRTWMVEHPVEPLLETVKPLGFTEESFKACVADQKILDGIDWVRTRAHEKLKVVSTPTFFINGRIHVGFLSIDEMEPLLRP